jgi:hypothetical protein
MKRMIFLARHQFNDEHFNIGDEKKFVTEWKGGNAKNKNYFPEDLLQLLVETGTVIVYDPDHRAEEYHFVMSSHANKLETINDQFCKGYISADQLLHQQILSATQSLIMLDNLDAAKLCEEDQLKEKISRAKAKAKEVPNEQL